MTSEPRSAAQTRSVTVERERDKDGRLWLVIRSARFGWQYARRQTDAEVKALCTEQGWVVQP